MQIANGELAIEYAPELYFVTNDYLNSAGGKFEHYDGFGFGVESNDLAAKPSILSDFGYWESPMGASLETLMIQGHPEFPTSNNTGVYKNFALGYALSGVAMSLPPSWSPAATGNLGDARRRAGSAQLRSEHQRRQSVQSHFRLRLHARGVRRNAKPELELPWRGHCRTAAWVGPVRGHKW